MTHGTLTAYFARGCRCDDCCTTARRYNKRLRLDRHRGLSRLVDATPARDHVAALLAGGMSFRAISIAAGWRSRNALDEALKRDRVQRRTLARILAVTPDSDTRHDGYVDATGSRRRLQALAVVGWPTRAVAGWLGHADHSTVLDVRSGRLRTVRRRTATAIADAYDAHWDEPGPSERTRRHAARSGWLPPMAWDDDLIDDPAHRPDPDVRRRPDGRGTPREDVLELLAQGETHAAIAARLGISEAAVDRARYGRSA
jgi:lambda repressor-like predicted transcriptional regulator